MFVSYTTLTEEFRKISELETTGQLFNEMLGCAPKFIDEQCP